MKSTSNSSEASSSVLCSSGLVGVDTLPGRSDGVETSGKVYDLTWDTLKTGWTLTIQGGRPSSRYALVPLRALMRKGPSHLGASLHLLCSSGRFLVCNMTYWPILNSRCLCHLSYCCFCESWDFAICSCASRTRFLTLVAKSSDYGCIVSVPIARSIGKAMLSPYNSSNAGF